MRFSRPDIAALLLLASLPALAGDIAWEGGVTAVFQDSDDSRVESEATLSLDLFASLPRASGEWLVYIEGSTTPNADGVSSFYPTVNGDARSVLTRSGSGSIQVSEFNYTFALAEGRRSLMLGLIDPSAWLDRGRIANDENVHFLNGSFVNNATIEFPDYTLGAVYRRIANGAAPELTFILSGSDGILDMPDRSYQGLLDLTDQGRGVFAGFGAAWLRSEFSWRAGAWLRSDDHVHARDPTRTEMNYGAYGVFGWLSGPHAVNVRAGIANDNVSITSEFVAVAYQHQTRFGLAGAGLARTFIADGFRGDGVDHAWDAELFLRIPVLGGDGHITPSLQYVRNPGFDASGAAASSRALVAGLRFRWSFER